MIEARGEFLGFERQIVTPQVWIILMSFDRIKKRE